jgi:hypothetical protein
MRRLCVFSLLLFPVFASTAFSQPNDTRKPASAEVAKAKGEKDLEAERILRERRANAQSLLISLASDADRYNDSKLRARTLGRIAYALWDADAERSRALFRRAWDAAETVDQEAQRKQQEEIKEQQAKKGSYAVTNPPNIRGEVLRLAARRDRKIGEELLAKLNSEKQQEAADASDRLRNFRAGSQAASQRLSLARQLLDADVERALQFADPALGSINQETLDFLSYLREKDAGAADQRYAALLAVADRDLQSDANTVSILSSYLFTPHTFVTFDNNGSSVSSSSRNNAPPDVSPQLRDMFFRTAAGILLRPLAPPGQDQSSSGIQGKYLMMKRLMPLFEQYGTREMTEAVRTQMEALTNLVPEDARQRDDNTVREGIRPRMSNEEREKYLLDRASRAKTSDERDQIYVELARLFTDSDDNRARNYVDKIDDSDFRQKVRAYIDASMLMNAVGKKSPDRVIELVRTGELTHFQKSWGLSQAARFLGKGDHDRALAVLEEADAEARRIDPADADRPRALISVVGAMLTIDRSKAWEAIDDVTKAANSAPEFTGEDGVMRTSLVSKSNSSFRSSSSGEFNLEPLFTDLANDNFEKSIELARLFEREAPRAAATIAIARTVLDEKKKN